MALKRTQTSQPSLQDYRSALERALSELPSPTILVGECEFLRAEAVAAYRSQWLERFPDGDTVVVRGVGDGKPATLSDVTAELSGGSLFAKDKLVVVREAGRLLFPSSRAADGADAVTGPAKDREKAFLERLESRPAGIWLVLEMPQLPQNRTMGKRLKEKGVLVPCPIPYPRDLSGWMTERLRPMGKSIEEAASDLLMRAHGTDLGVLAGELDKLALFAGDGRKIDAAMVGEFLTGTIEFDIFGFTNAIEARDVDKAVFFARRIAVQGARDQKGKKEDGTKSAHRVLSMLAGTVQTLLRARVALARRMRPAEFAAAEKMSPVRADFLFTAARRFTLPELRHMTRFAADQVRMSHDTGGDAPLSLELMAVKFTAAEIR